MVEVEKDGKMLTFNYPMDLEKLGDIMAVYDRLFVILTGKHATYGQFTDYLVWSGVAK